MLESDLGQAEMEAAALTRTIEELTAQLEARSEERRQCRARSRRSGRGAEADGERGSAHRTPPAGVDSAGRSATKKRARPSTQSLSRSAKRQCGSRRSAPRPRRPWNSSRRSLLTMRQQRETLQQEAAQLTAELAGLEERRRGAEAAFQRIDRLHADLERRVLAIRAAARGCRSRTRAAHSRECRSCTARAGIDCARSAEALAQAEAIAARRLRCASNWRRWRRN